MTPEKITKRIVNKVKRLRKLDPNIEIAGMGIAIGKGPNGRITADNGGRICGMGALLVGHGNKIYDIGKHATGPRSTYAHPIAHLLKITIPQASALEWGFMNYRGHDNTGLDEEFFNAGLEARWQVNAR